MTVPWITWPTFVLQLVVGLAFLWQSRQLPRSRALAFVGLALVTSFLFDASSIWVGLVTGDNSLLLYAWPMVTGILLLFGVGRLVSDAMAGAAMILILGFLLGVSATSAEGLVRDGALVQIITAVIVAWTLAKGLYHRTGLAAAIWIFYLVPAPALVAGVYDPGVHEPVFWFARGCQLLGLLVFAGWLHFRTRTPSGSRPSRSSSASSLPSVGASPGPWTTSAPNSSKSAKPIEPWRGSTI